MWALPSAVEDAVEMPVLARTAHTTSPERKHGHDGEGTWPVRAIPRHGVIFLWHR